MGKVFILRSMSGGMIFIGLLFGVCGVLSGSKWQQNVDVIRIQGSLVDLTVQETTSFWLGLSVVLLTVGAYFLLCALSGFITDNRIVVRRDGVYVPSFMQRKLHLIRRKHIKDFYVTAQKNAPYGRLVIKYGNRKRYNLSSRKLSNPSDLPAIYDYLMVLVGSELHAVQKRVADSYRPTRKLNPLYYAVVLLSIPFFLLSIAGFATGQVFVPNPADIMHSTVVTGVKLKFYAGAYGLWGTALFLYTYLHYIRVNPPMVRSTVLALFVLGGALIRFVTVVKM